MTDKQATDAMEAHGPTDEDVAILIPGSVIDAICARAAELALERLRAEPPPVWLYGAKAAAEHLGWPTKRVHNKVATGEVPHHRNGSRLQFRTDELDRYLAEDRHHNM